MKLPVLDANMAGHLGRWTVSAFMLMLAGSCATAELKPGSVDETAALQFQAIRVQVALADKNDTASLKARLIEELQRYDLQFSLKGEFIEKSAREGQRTALLTIDELDRHNETTYYRRTYGRTSLTQMHGRKSRVVPVITVRVVLTDIEADKAVFQAEFVTQGAWYADGTKRVASIAPAATGKLAQDGFIVK